MIYTIYAENFDRFEDKMKKLQRKAKKIGNGKVEFKILNESFKQVDAIWHKIIEIEITDAEVPKINGWEFVSSINHYSKDNNLLNIVPTFKGEIPERYKKIAQYCEHCNSNRMRKDTYILFNETTQEFKQVGKSCLKDFLGHQSPEQFVAYAEKLIELDEEEWENLPRGGYAVNYINLIDWVALTQAVVKVKGYVSKAKADESNDVATVNIVHEQMFNTVPLKETIVADNKDIEFAEKVITYIKEIEPKTSYEENLKVIASSECMELRVSGYVTSFIPYYVKAMEYLKAKELKDAQVINSEFYGEKGQKIELQLKVDKVIIWENMYGTTKMHIMRSLEGNLFTWKASSQHLDEGKIYTIKGTIQDHVEYEGKKQTSITRCKASE